MILRAICESETLQLKVLELAVNAKAKNKNWGYLAQYSILKEMLAA